MRLTSKEWLAQAKRDERARCILALRHLRDKIERLEPETVAEVNSRYAFAGGQLALFDLTPPRHGSHADALPA